MFSRPFPRSLIALIVFIAIVNIVAIQYFWYWRMRWLDMPMHFLGGVWLAGTILWFRFFSHPLLETPKNFSRVLFWGILGAFVIGLGWEVYESAVSLVTIGKINAIRDSLSDLCFDMIGGFVGAVIVWFRIKK